MFYIMTQTDINQMKFILNNGSKVRVGDKVYEIYAFMICGKVNDVVFVHVFEEGSLISFAQNRSINYINVNMNNGSYLFLQLGYVTPPTCDHANYIQDVANTFLFTALKGN